MQLFKCAIILILFLFTLTSCFEDEVNPQDEYYNSQWKINTNPNIHEFNTHDSILVRAYFKSSLMRDFRSRGQLYNIPRGDISTNVESPCFYSKASVKEDMNLGIQGNENYKISYGRSPAGHINKYRYDNPVSLFDPPHRVMWKTYPTGPAKGLLVFTLANAAVTEYYASDTLKYNVNGMNQNFNMATDKNFKLNVKFTDRFVFPDGRAMYTDRDYDVFPASDCQ